MERKKEKRKVGSESTHSAVAECENSFSVAGELSSGFDGPFVPIVRKSHFLKKGRKKKI